MTNEFIKKWCAFKTEEPREMVKQLDHNQSTSSTGTFFGTIETHVSIGNTGQGILLKIIIEESNMNILRVFF